MLPPAPTWQAPAPSHITAPGHVAFGSVPTVTKLHVPFTPPVSAALQLSQVPLHAEEQQTPSAQNPLAHCVPKLQACPISIWQPPEPLHFSALMPSTHSFIVSWPASVGAQVPPATPVRALLHELHVPLQTLLQHTPSTQKPVTHSPPMVHASPGPFTHAPMPLQTPAPAHSLAGSVFRAILVHVPTEPRLLHA